MSIVATTIAAAEGIDKLSKAVGILAKLRSLVVVQPEAAVAELAEIVNEIRKAPPTIRLALNALDKTLAGDSLDPDAVARLADGSLEAEVEKARPHCHRIRQLPQKHLSQLLDQGGTSGADRQDLKDLLSEFCFADDDMFNELVKFARRLKAPAREARVLLRRAKTAEARALLLALVEEVEPERLGCRRHGH
jgi:hypothetical protein